MMRSRLRRRGKGTLVGATVVLVATVALAVWLLTTGPGPQAVTDSPSTIPPRDAVAAGASCNPPSDQSADALVIPPVELQWSVLAGNVVPSAAAGPGLVQGSVARCFAHDAAGALLAAIRIPLAIGTAGADTWRGVVDAGLVPGPGTDAVVAIADQAYSVIGAGATGQSPAPVAGFKFIAYSPSEAVVAVVFRNPTGALFVSDTVVVWFGGDWRVEPGLDGQLGSPPAQVASLVGFVALEQP
jgi:hypothetical protein